MDLMDTIAWRSSSRSFLDQQLTDVQLRTILQAANAAPVSMGKREDVQLVVIQNADLIAKIEKVTEEFTQENFGRAVEHSAYGAPTIILVAGKKHEGMLNTQAFLNTGCIMENMLLAATSLGLGSVFIYMIAAALLQNKELCEELTLPEDFFPVSVMAVGTSAEQSEKRDLTVDALHTSYLK